MLHRITKRFSLLLLVSLLTAIPITTVYAQSSALLPPEQLEAIRSRCSSAQISIQQLQKRDAVSRINRGRAYDQLMNQIAAFNSRLAYNNINISELITISKELKTHVDQFRTISDQMYLEHLGNAIKLDCKNKPTEFYALIVKAREDRDRVVGEVDKIDQLMALYRERLMIYRSTLSPTDKGAAQ